MTHKAAFVDRQAKARRGRQPAPRDAIVEAARRTFLAYGYSISIDTIAQAAGVSRTTLYNQFGSKEALLRAVVEDSSRALMAPLTEHGDRDLSSTLTEYAKRFETLAMGEDGAAFARFYVADLSRFPDLARLAYDRGMKLLTDTLAAYLTRQIAAGHVRHVDTNAMAERFFGALIGFGRHRFYAGYGIDAAQRRRRYVRGTVEIFEDALRA